MAVRYSYFYQLDSNRAVCNFTTLDNSMSIATRLIDYDSLYVYCYTPPANLFNTTTLYDNGGPVKVYISSNGRDFTDDYFLFTYL